MKETGLTALKHPMARVLAPLLSLLIRTGVRPNTVTAINILFCVLTGWWGITLSAADQRALYVILAAAIALRLVLNVIDGALARTGDMATPRGALLNEAGDVLCEAALLAPLLAVPGIAPLAVFAVLALALAVEQTGLAALEIGAARRRGGPASKPERAFILAALYLGLALGLSVAWATVALVIMAFLSAVTLVRLVFRD